MNWYSPIEAPQLMPKDLLRYARKLSKDEVNRQITAAVKSLYSHSNNSNYWVGPTLGTATAAGFGYSTISTYNNWRGLTSYSL